MTNELQERITRDLTTLSKSQEEYARQLRAIQADYRKTMAEIIAASPDKEKLDALREREHELAGLIVTNNGRIEYAEELLGSMQEPEVKAMSEVASEVASGLKMKMTPNGEELSI